MKKVLLQSGGVYDITDIKLKEKIVPLTDSIEKITSLGGFYFKNESRISSSRESGIFARDIEDQMPEVLSTDEQGHTTVDYIKLMPVLIEAIKELKEANDQCKYRLDMQEEALNQYQADRQMTAL